MMGYVYSLARSQRQKLKQESEHHDPKHKQQYLMARYPCTQSSSNHLKEGESVLPPMMRTISPVIFMSGSQPRFPPGELSNMKPKSVNVSQHQT